MGGDIVTRFYSRRDALRVAALGGAAVMAGSGVTRAQA